jgi:hypothetical protein
MAVRCERELFRLKEPEGRSSLSAVIRGDAGESFRAAAPGDGSFTTRRDPGMDCVEPCLCQFR